MNETSRLFTALIISMGAIFLWNQYYVNPKLEAQKHAIEAQKTIDQGATRAAIDPQTAKDFVKQKVDILTGAKDKAQNNSAPASDAKIAEMEAVSTLSRAEILKQGTRVAIKTDNLHGSINLKGAVFDDVTLAKYPETLDDNSPEVALLTPRAMPGLYFLNTGWVSGETRMPDDSSVWQVESGKVLTPSTPVTLKYNNGEGQIFRKVISVDDGQMITTKLSVENRGAKAVSVLPYGLINRSWDMNRKQIYVSHEGPIAVADKVLNEVKYKKLAKDGAQEFTNVTGWTGIGDKYWLSAIIPQNSDSEKFNISFKHYTKNNVDRFQADIIAQPQTIAPGANAEYSFNIFAGAKKLDMLEKYQEQFKIDLFDHAIDFGWFYFLTKPIFMALTFFHAHIGNMGLSIMLLTVCVRLIMFPIASKSFSSMARMKKHAPEIAAIKERFKKDRQKQGVEIMKYYKAHKINPASGCLPMFIQIPVFFSLYKVLYVSIEMRHAPFALWIHDLSAIDPTNVFNLFGLVMWNVPHFLPTLGVLPILYASTMWLQQKLNPPMADESQRIMMAWMPWIFMFLFSGFASGLVIYWIWNNSLSILQQWVITSRVKEDRKQ